MTKAHEIDPGLIRREQDHATDGGGIDATTIPWDDVRDVSIGEPPFIEVQEIPVDDGDSIFNEPAVRSVIGGQIIYFSAQIGKKVVDIEGRVTAVSMLCILTAMGGFAYAVLGIPRQQR